MEKKQNNSEFKDDMLYALFQDFETDQAPKGMRQKTMNAIFQDWAAHPVGYEPIITKQNRFWILVVLSGLLIISFLIDASVLKQYWESLNLSFDLDSFKSISDSFVAFYVLTKQIPSVVYFVLIGISVLLGLDQFLHRLAKI